MKRDAIRAAHSMSGIRSLGSTVLPLIACFWAASAPAYATDGDYLWAGAIHCSYAATGGISLEADSDGNVYTAGRFWGTADFDPGTGTANLTPVGDGDIFISKMDRVGHLVWVRQIGGVDNEEVLALARDVDGNLYITGQLFGTADFDPGVGTLYLTSEGDSDIFVAKYDASGVLVWAKNMGGGGFDEGVSIAVDGDGNVYTTGEFANIVDFDPSPGTYNVDAGLTAIFVCKLTSTGELAWANRFVGGINKAGGIAVDDNDGVYTTGRFDGATDFDPGTGNVTLTDVGASDVFITKLSSEGAFEWAKQMGGYGEDAGSAVTVDSTGDVILGGNFAGVADFDPGPGTAEMTSVRYYEAFVAKLDSSGSYLWARQMGANICRSVAVDAGDFIFATGYLDGYLWDTADLDPGTGTDIVALADGLDIFVSKLSSAGTYVWGRSMGGIGSELGNDIAVDRDSNVLFTGYYANTVDFDPGSGTANLTCAGQEAYIAKFSGPTPPSVSSITRASQDPTDEEYVEYTVVFDQSVTGVDATDFNLVVTGINGAYVSNVSGSGATYTVTVYVGMGEGTIRLDVVDDDSIVDGESAPLGNAGAGNGNYTSGDQYHYFPALPLHPWPIAAAVLLVGLWLARRTHSGHWLAKS